MNHRVLIGLGSSLGARANNLRLAVAQMQAHPLLSVVKISRVYRSVPLGEEAHGIFSNQCVVIQTELSPTDLLQLLQTIEVRTGRVRSRRWADRMLDLDILLYDDVIMEGAGLDIPHKGLAFRSFVIQPAQEIAGDWQVPTLNKKIKELKVPVPRCW